MVPGNIDRSRSRRTFLKQATAAIVGSGLASTLGSARAAHVGGDHVLKVGLIGCGGRGCAFTAGCGIMAP